jgi:hypothetical protein
MLTSLRTKIDCLDLSGRVIAVMPTTWGRIRFLYR